MDIEAGFAVPVNEAAPAPVHDVNLQPLVAAAWMVTLADAFSQSFPIGGTVVPHPLGVTDIASRY